MQSFTARWLFAAVPLLSMPEMSWAAEQPSSLFTQSIAPLLQERCVECHNSGKPRGSLILTDRDSLLRGGDNGPAIVPGHADRSLIVHQISGIKPKMPKRGQPLGSKQIGDLRRWIDEGALWPPEFKLNTPARREAKIDRDWWSLKPLARPALPRSNNTLWIRTPIDAFVLDRLESKALQPAPAADRVTLIRRVTYDLLGLPPTPGEIDAFLGDSDPAAYEKLIDRLLASPHYGERWGRHWLDVVHYGDTHGYDKDKRRDHAWPYRDNVIQSFNCDLPYGQFVMKQVAGDVLDPANPDAVVATGFIAAGPWDFVGQVELREGTVDKEKTRLIDRDDMLSTTISTFMSLTVHCARCHDHKFDPISQRDYYRLQAVFAGVDRGDRVFANPRGTAFRRVLVERHITISTRRQKLLQRASELRSPELARLDAEVKVLRRKLSTILLLPAGAASPSNGYHSAIMPLSDATKWVQVDLGQSAPIREIRLTPARPTDFPDSPGFGFPSRFRIDVSDDPAFVKFNTVSDQTQADFSNPGNAPFVVRLSSRSARYVRVTATRLWPRTGDFVFALAELEVEGNGKNLARGAAVSALDSIEAGRWSTKYLVDGFDSRTALPDLANPSIAADVVRHRDLTGRIHDLELHRAALAASLLDVKTRIALEASGRELAELTDQIKKLQAPDQVYAAISHFPRPIHLLRRGDVEQPGPLVLPGPLSCLPELASDFQINDNQNEGQRRAALARWLTDRRNPLTWRSIVNRIWHYHFGRGLVDTPNDFGRNGSRPTHPELLDWLAMRFLEDGQSLKKLHRLILMSAVYRQSSQHDPACAKVDADNRFLWRMNRQRLDAESIRDAVLAISGKLDPQMGGPGFELFRFKEDHSPIYDHAALEKINDPRGWRRAVYRFVVRSVPNPFLDCLDCADPNINTPVRNTTLTALQALALLNDPFMIQQSKFFAARLQSLSPEPPTQLTLAYRLVFGRAPTAEEQGMLAHYGDKYGLTNACRLLFNANEFVFID